MKKMKLFLIAIASLFIASSVYGQVEEVFVSKTGSNYHNNLTKVDWNWARMWVEDNEVTEAAPNPKVTHGVMVFSVADMVSQTVGSAKLSFNFEKIATGDLPATVELYYKEPYIGYRAVDVNYPEGCTALGTVELTTAGQIYDFSNDALKAYVQSMIDAGQDAVVFMRATTPNVKLSILGSINAGADYPTLTLTVPEAVTYAPSATISNISGVAKDFFGMTPKDTLAIDFSKSMNTSSVEEKISLTPAPASKAFIWQGDTIVNIVCAGLEENAEISITLAAGALASDATATKSDVVKEFTTFYDNVIRSQGNFWNLDGVSKTNALSVANSDSAELVHDRKSFVYLDLAGTTPASDFKGFVLKCFDHQDANGWVKGPITPENTTYALYDVEFATFGAAFDGAAFDGMTKTKICDVIMDSTYTIYTVASQEMIFYLRENAGKQICIAILDETPTVSASKPTIWISDPSNNPDQGAPVVVYSDPASAALSAMAAQNVSVYPMPVTGDVLSISGVNVAAAKVYSLVGSLALSTAVENNQINVSTLKNGVYFVKLDTDKGSIVKQIVVE